jgi:carbamate kinase
MPKIKDPTFNLLDAQTNLSVFRSKMEKNNQEFALEQVNAILSLLKTLIREYSIKTHGEGSTITNLLADNKATKSQSVRSENVMIDRIYACTNMKDAVTVGLTYNIDQKELASLIKRAPYNTALGKVMLIIKQKEILKQLPTEPEPSKPIFAATNNSDNNNHTPPTEDDDVIMDDDLMSKLSSK